MDIPKHRTNETKNHSSPEKLSMSIFSGIIILRKGKNPTCRPNENR